MGRISKSGLLSRFRLVYVGVKNRTLTNLSARPSAVRPWCRGRPEWLEGPALFLALEYSLS